MAISIDVIDFEDPEKFVEYLRPTNPVWGVSLQSEWVFRGHEDASWSLQPKAWRKDGQAILAPLIDRFRAETESVVPDPVTVYFVNEPRTYNRSRFVEAITQRATECEAVLDFARIANEIGYPVPDLDIPSGSQQAGNYADVCYGAEFPVNNTFCLAQHHGIPTRLLDWTRHPLIAAFFATQRLDPDPSRYVCVWAMNLNKIGGSLRTLQPPRHRFSFLHAQDALLVWYASAEEYLWEHGKWPDFRDVIGKPAKNCAQTGTSSIAFRKLTLSSKFQKDVVEMLWRERLTLARLMPTYDNVAQTVKTKWLLER